MNTITDINQLWSSGIYYRNTKKQIIKRVLLILNGIPFNDIVGYSKSELKCDHENCRKPIKCKLIKGGFEQWYIQGIHDAVKFQIPKLKNSYPSGDDVKNHIEKHIKIVK